MLKMGGDNVGRLVWMRAVGEGWVFAYHGPPNTDESPGLPHKGGYEAPPPECEIEKPVSYPVLFFRDILAYLAQHRDVCGVELETLWLGEEPVFLSDTEDGLVALNVGDAEALLPRDGRRVAIPAQTISRLRAE